MTRTNAPPIAAAVSAASSRSRVTGAANTNVSRRALWSAATAASRTATNTPTGTASRAYMVAA
ncbi:hypothetical protein AB0B71_15890 [Micromonospora echinofusca]|uniref:hypothetical protein n=1 Tax=Micromonospora echinofusca TaxID=47858 RepID=UPI0033D082CA